MGMNTGNLSTAHILRSAMESAAFGLKMGLDAFREQGLSAGKIHLTGGGSNSPVWRQIISDIFGIPVECPATSEAAALGAGLQALWALEGGKGSIERITNEHTFFDPGKRTLPLEKTSGAYLQAYSLYEQYLEAVSPLYK